MLILAIISAFYLQESLQYSFARKDYTQLESSLKFIYRQNFQGQEGEETVNDVMKKLSKFGSASENQNKIF